MITTEELDAAISIFFSDQKNKLLIDELAVIFCESEKSRVEILYLQDQFINHIVCGGQEMIEVNIRRLIVSSIIFGYCIKETLVKSNGVKN